MKRHLIRTTAVLVTSLILASCAGTQPWLRNLEVSGALAIEPTDKFGADYRVKFKDVVDIGYNGDSRADRLKVLNTYAAAQCPAGFKILREDAIKTGQWISGSSSEDYYIYIKCNKS